MGGLPSTLVVKLERWIRLIPWRFFSILFLHRIYPEGFPGTASSGNDLVQQPRSDARTGCPCERETQQQMNLSPGRDLLGHLSPWMFFIIWPALQVRGEGVDQSCYVQERCKIWQRVFECELVCLLLCSKGRPVKRSFVFYTQSYRFTQLHYRHSYN